MPDRARIAVIAERAAVRESLDHLLGSIGLPKPGSAASNDADLIIVAVDDPVGAVREARRLAPEAIILSRCAATDPALASTEDIDDLLEPELPPRVVAQRVLAHVHRALGRRARIGLQEIEQAIVSAADMADGVREACVVLADLARASWVGLALVVDDSCWLAIGSDGRVAERRPLDVAAIPALRDVLAEGQEWLSDQRDRQGRTGLALAFPADVGPVALLPLTRGRRTTGALLLARSQRDLPFGGGTIAVGRAVASALSLAVPDGASLFRDKTNRTNLRAFEAERLARAIDAHREFFEASSDGVFVIDESCAVVYANHAAQLATGFRADGLVGRRLVELVPETQRDGLVEIVQKVLGGAELAAFDLHLSNTSGDPIIASAATSSALAEHGAVVLTFRDVTEARALHHELRKTAEFLERLIDSTVDAIVASDMRGRVLLFNKGAERIYGWRADEVIGKLHVDRLYPEGVARAVMRQLRSADYGGVGRLVLTRKEILTKGGEAVPVNMTASIIYENRHEAATVGIFTDLRERLGIERRLAAAQERLQLSERQAVLAELAGTTAHELNQPLTSIMGYAELLKRRTPADDPRAAAVDVILQEAERMADIVRKIGKITRYETKEYVGETQILDLDRSTTEEDGRANGEGEDAEGTTPGREAR